MVTCWRRDRKTPRFVCGNERERESEREIIFFYGVSQHQNRRGLSLDQAKILIFCYVSNISKAPRLIMSDDLCSSCAADWLYGGPVPIWGVCDIILAYSPRLKGILQSERACAGGRVWAMVVISRPGETPIRLALASEDKLISVVDAVSGECLRKLDGHTDIIRTLTVMPDGKLASGSKDETIRIWDVETGSCVRTLVGPSSDVYALSALPDGRLVSGSCDTRIQLWRPERDGSTDPIEGHKGSVSALAVLPDGRLASGSGDKTVRVWDLAKGVCTLTLTGHTRAISALAVIDDKTLASGSYDSTVRVWDVGAQCPEEVRENRSGACILTLCGHGSRVTSLAVLSDGKLVSGSYDRTIRVWDPKSGTCKLLLIGHLGDVTALAALPDGRLVSGSADKTIRVWE
jgi:hypothetical protein